MQTQTLSLTPVTDPERPLPGASWAETPAAFEAMLDEEAALRHPGRALPAA